MRVFSTVKALRETQPHAWLRNSDCFSGLFPVTWSGYFDAADELNLNPAQSSRRVVGLRVMETAGVATAGVGTTGVA